MITQSDFVLQCDRMDLDLSKRSVAFRPMADAVLGSSSKSVLPFLHIQGRLLKERQIRPGVIHRRWRYRLPVLPRLKAVRPLALPSQPPPALSAPMSGSTAAQTVPNSRLPPTSRSRQCGPTSTPSAAPPSCSTKPVSSPAPLAPPPRPPPPPPPQPAGLVQSAVATRVGASMNKADLQSAAARLRVVSSTVLPNGRILMGFHPSFFSFV